MVTMEDIRKAAEVLDGVARRTDLIYAPKLSGKNEIYFKTENLQHTGSFKLRGAYNKVHNMTDEEKARGIIACSAGNHAQGVALAAKKAGCKAIICMPDCAPIMKVEATKAYGAEVVLVPNTYDDAHDEAERLVKEKGYTLAHPYDDPYTIAGQGTIGLEIMEQLPEADAVVVPIGGGGLLAGIAIAVKSIKPEIKVYGVQAKGANAMCQSFHKGKKVVTDTAHTIADGIQVKNPGDLTYEIIKEYVDDVFEVSEDEISAAILALIEKQKLIAEGAGAVPCAAVMFDKIPLEGKKIVCMLSGGNVDVNMLSRIVSRGLIMGGRKINITVMMPDIKGALAKACTTISACGANVIDVHHDRTELDLDINAAYVTFELETRDFEMGKQIKHELEKVGYTIVSHT